jgi:hypothetical protein
MDEWMDGGARCEAAGDKEKEPSERASARDENGMEGLTD